MELPRYTGRVRHGYLIRIERICRRRVASPLSAGIVLALVRRITTYPVQLAGPLEGKEVHVGRVALYECITCGHLMPTPAGQAKIDRNVAMAIRFFLEQID